MIGARTAAALLLGFLGACRPGTGDPCVCADDCRGGLVCAAGGRVLRQGECVLTTDTDRIGECVPAADAPDDDDALPPPPLYYDLGSRRDLDPGQPPGGETTTGTTTGDMQTESTDTGTTATQTTATETTTSETDTASTDTGTGDARVDADGA